MAQILCKMLEENFINVKQKLLCINDVSRIFHCLLWNPPMKYLLDSKGQIWPCLETKAIIKSNVIMK